MRWSDVSDARAALRGCTRPTAGSRSSSIRWAGRRRRHGRWCSGSWRSMRMGSTRRTSTRRCTTACSPCSNGATRGGRAAELAAFDARLAVDAIRYVAAMRYGRARLRWVDDTVNIGKGILTVRRAPMDVGEVITTVRMSPEPATVLFQLEDRARRTVSCRRRSRAIARSRPTARSPCFRGFPPGWHRASATPVRRHCAGSSWPWATSPTRSRRRPPESDTIYDSTLARGVKRLQQRENLPPDGIIAKKTAARLGTPFADPGARHQHDHGAHAGACPRRRRTASGSG